MKQDHRKKGNLIIFRPSAFSKFKDIPDEDMRLAIIINHVLRKLEKDRHFKGLEKSILFDVAAMIAGRVHARKTATPETSVDQISNEEIEKAKATEKKDFDAIYERIFGCPPDDKDKS